MKLLATLSASLLLGALLPAQAVYFVDGVNGSDSNAGTRANPWLSLTFALPNLLDNDTLIVLPGTYASSTTGEVWPLRLGSATSQKNVKVISEGGAAVTILDGEQQMSSSLIPILRCYWMADGAKISGLTLQNTGSADYWSMAVRLGSTSGGNYAVKDVEISNCVIRAAHKGIVCFGTNPSNINVSDGIKIHDNVFDSCTNRSLEIWGEGNNYFYNNTFVNSAHDCVYVDALYAPSSNALVANNIAMGGTVAGFAVGQTTAPGGTTATFENNNSFNCNPDYGGMTFSPSNINVDPMFVGATDLHLQAGSPMIQAGMSALPIVRVDHDNFARAHDSDGDGAAKIDIGAYQYTQYGMTITGTWGLGQTATFNFKAPTIGGGILFMSLGRGGVTLSPYGTFAFDLAQMFANPTVGQVPGAVPIPIPNDTNLLGLTFVMQGGFFDPTLANIHMLSAEERSF